MGTLGNLDIEKERLIHLALANNTQAAYSSAWEKFKDFASRTGLKGTIPLSVIEISYFIAYMSREGYAQATVASYLAGIAYRHRIMGFPDPTNTFIIKKMLDGLRKDRGPSNDTRLPITQDLLKNLIASLETVTRSQFEQSLFKAAFLLAFFGFLRVGELAANSKSQVQDTMLRRSDIKFIAHDGSPAIEINFRVSKNNQFGQRQVILIPSQKFTALCPVSALRQYLSVAGSSLVLFSHFDLTPLTKYQFSAMLRKTVEFCGFPNSQLFKSHSFRIGAATSARLHGLSDGEIQVLGRWRSGVFSNYIRLPQFTNTQ